MKTIGLVGGVASGKSVAARLLADLGAGLLDADRAGHAVLVEDAEVQRELLRRWGQSIIAADGAIDREAVASRVFGTSAEAVVNRQWLENLLHPRIRQRLEKLRDQFVTEGKPAVVLDAPLLLEAGWRPMCDVVLMIDAPREMRLERARQRDWSEEDFAQREAAQWSAERKQRNADIVIGNTGSEDDLRHAIHDFWRANIAPGKIDG